MASFGTLTPAEMAQLMAEEQAHERRVAMHEAREWAKERRAEIDAEWNALPDVPRSIEQHLEKRA